MTVRLAGILLVVCSCAGIGFLKSFQMGRRYRLLREWQHILLLISHEVRYGTAFPTACRVVGERTEEPFPAFFCGLASQLETYSGQSFGAVFSRELHRAFQAEPLGREDFAVMEQLGEMMGEADRQMQCQILDRCEKELELFRTALREQLPVQQRLYRSLGCLAGAFFGIWLA